MTVAPPVSAAGGVDQPWGGEMTMPTLTGVSESLAPRRQVGEDSVEA